MTRKSVVGGARLQDTLDDVCDGGVRVGAAAAGLDGVGPGAAQRGALLAQPGVAQQRPGARPSLRVLLEALQQEALHVLRDVFRQRWVLILQMKGTLDLMAELQM